MQATLTLPCAAQATLGLFAWTEEAKPAELACRAAHAETAAKAKLLARVGAPGRAPHALCSILCDAKCALRRVCAYASVVLGCRAARARYVRSILLTMSVSCRCAEHWPFSPWRQPRWCLLWGAGRGPCAGLWQD